MADLDDVRRFLADETGLVVVSTPRDDGSVLSAVVNAGVLAHPVDGDARVGLVSMAGAGRVAHIRRGRPVTITARRGWKWVSVTGRADLIGPDDVPSGLDADAVRMLLRDVFAAAGGVHDDLDEYDRVMADERRVAVLVVPERIYGVV